MIQFDVEIPNYPGADNYENSKNETWKYYEKEILLVLI